MEQTKKNKEKTRNVTTTTKNGGKNEDNTWYEKNTQKNI